MEIQLNKILNALIKKINQRSSGCSLNKIRRWEHVGIESWLKVELVNVLTDLDYEIKNKGIKNRGPDILFKSGEKIELKAGTDLNFRAVVESIKNYKCPCLFLFYNRFEQNVRNEIKHRLKIAKVRGKKMRIESLSNKNTPNWTIGFVY